MSTQRTVEKNETEEASSPIDPRAESNESLDRQKGSGSLTREEGWVAETEIEGMNDGRYDTRTTFYSWEAEGDGPPQKERDPSDRRSWSDLAKWNDGMWEPDRSVQNFDADVRRWTQTFCNYLDLPSYQYDRVQYVMNDVDLTEFRPNGFSAEKVILGVISLVVDTETDEEDIDEWDIEEWIVYDDDFESLMIDVGMVSEDETPERSTLWEVRKVVQSKSDYFDG